MSTEPLSGVVETPQGPIDVDAVIAEVEAAIADRDDDAPPPTQREVAEHAGANAADAERNFGGCYSRYGAVGDWDAVLEAAGVTTVRERVAAAIAELPATKTSVNAGRIAPLIDGVAPSRIGKALAALSEEPGGPVGERLELHSRSTNWRLRR